MSCHSTRRQRWLAIVAALLILLSGDGLHALTHFGAGAVHDEAASGHAEAHAGDCPHRPHAPHESHPCRVCHVGFTCHTLLAPAATARASARLTGSLPNDLTWFAGAASAPGALGARAPPLLSA